MTRIVPATALAGAAVLTTAGCVPGPSLPAGDGSPSAPPLTVFAAASLTEVMERIAAGFEGDHPGVDVRITYGGSADLAAQIREGAPADVFASANQAQMDAVADQLGAEPVLFAQNHLVIAVPDGNPARVRGLVDLERVDVVSVVCAPQVPCGAATAALASLEGLTLAPASEEQSVTEVLGKVVTGQADAGVVYATDLARGEGVEGVAIAGAERVLTQYPAAPLAAAADPGLAGAFVDYLRGPVALEALGQAGFGRP